MHFLFIAGVGKTHQPPHDLQLKNCIKTNIYFLYYNVNIFLKIMSKKYCVVLINPSAAHKVEAVEKGSKFRFLASGSCTIVPPPEQKTKNAKYAVSSILTAYLKPHRKHFVLPPPLLKKRRHNLDIIFWRVSGALASLKHWIKLHAVNSTLDCALYF